MCVCVICLFRLKALLHEYAYMQVLEGILNAWGHTDASVMTQTNNLQVDLKKIKK